MIEFFLDYSIEVLLFDSIIEYLFVERLFVEFVNLIGFLRMLEFLLDIDS